MIDAWLAAWLLASARLWALLRVQASWRRAVGPIWEAVAAALALALAALFLLSGAEGIGVLELELAPAALLSALIFELLLGSVLGLALALPGWALVGAARASELGLGLRFDEAGELGEAEGSLARCLVCASLAAGLALGLHAPLLAGVFGLLERFQLAAAASWLPSVEQAPLWLAGLSFEALVLALALATPVLLLELLTAFALAAFARGGTRRELVAAVVPGLRLALSLIVLGAAWSAYPEAFARGMG